MQSGERERGGRGGAKADLLFSTVGLRGCGGEQNGEKGRKRRRRQEGPAIDFHPVRLACVVSALPRRRQWLK